MKQNLQLRISQNLALTPQLQQSIKLLQLSSLELNQELETILQDNPLLELVDSEGDESSFDEVDFERDQQCSDSDPLAADGQNASAQDDFETDSFSNLDYQEASQTSASES